MNTKSRRSFFKWAFTSLGFAAVLKSTSSYAKLACPQAAPTAEKVKKKLLDYTGKTAKRLAFVDNAATAKANKAKKVKGFNKFVDGSNCANCTFYKAPVDNYGRCAMVTNKYVPACGWCKSYKKNKKA